MENYKITLKAQKYLNANGPRSYSSNEYSQNDLPEPDDDPDDVEDIEEATPPPPPPAPKTAQLALPAPPKGMKPGPRTAKLAQQLGKQVRSEGDLLKKFSLIEMQKHSERERARETGTNTDILQL